MLELADAPVDLLVARECGKGWKGVKFDVHHRGVSVPIVVFIVAFVGD